MDQVRVFTNGCKWYVQDLDSGNIIHRSNNKQKAIDFVYHLVCPVYSIR